MMHAIESPTGLLHLATNNRRTMCGKAIDLDHWIDRGQTPPLATLTTILRWVDTANVCDRCFKR